MALTWLWKEKIGEAEIFNYDKVITYNLYKGNAFLIFIYEYEQDGKEMYNVSNFFVDETHAKRMLGLDKTHKETYGDNSLNSNLFRLQKIRLNKKEYKYTKKLVDMLIQAFDEITIELYSEDFEN